MADQPAPDRSGEAANLPERGVLSSLLDAMPDGVVLTATDGTIQFVNQQGQLLFGYQAEELIGQPIERLIPTRFYLRHVQHRAGYEDAPTVRPMGMGLALFGLRKDGSEFPVEISLSPLSFHGELYTVSTIRDMTQRLLLEQQAQREADLRRLMLQTIIDVLPSGVYLVRGPDAQLILANHAAQSIWGADWQEGQSMAEFLATSHTQICHPTGPAFALEELATIQAVRTGQAAYQRQEIMRRPDGTHLPIMVNAVPLDMASFGTMTPFSDERGAVVVLQDVSRLKEAEQLKDDFISSASHELRNPMGALKGFVSMFLYQGQRGKGRKLAAWQQEALAEIDMATDRLLVLTNDLVDITQIQAGRLTLHRATSDFVSLVRRVVAQMQANSSQHILVVHSTVDNLDLWMDALRMEQILTNLLSNAIKYSPDGGEIQVRIMVDEHAQKVQIQVQDHGMGIPQQQQARVFQRFARAGNGVERGIPGSGLGLFLCRELVERHAGRIWFASQEQQGTTFTVELPLMPPVPPNHPADVEAP